MLSLNHFVKRGEGKPYLVHSSLTSGRTAPDTRNHKTFLGEFVSKIPELLAGHR